MKTVSDHRSTRVWAATRTTLAATAFLSLSVIAACSDSEKSITAPTSVRSATAYSGGFANAGNVTVCTVGATATFTAAYSGGGQIPASASQITSDIDNHILLASSGTVAAGTCFDVYASLVATGDQQDTFARILLNVVTPPGYVLTGTTCVIDEGLVQASGTPYASGDFAVDCDVDGDATVWANFFHGTVVTFTFAPLESRGCTYTQGYYKTHESYTAGVLSSHMGSTFVDASGHLLIGSYALSSTQVDAILDTPVGKGYNADGVVFSKDQLGMIHQLITAELNVTQGANSSSIASTIIAANNYTGATKSTLSGWTNTLDSFNNGKLGSSHCD
ncbi:MAG TPA: hypothetical protein VM099_14105 [Gemmatimonadaceae bacterium]|nr:hypothetical protein [Gemmatimonadaceae bacterium]